MGQVGWLLYEKGETDGLTGVLADFMRQSFSVSDIFSTPRMPS